MGQTNAVSALLFGCEVSQMNDSQMSCTSNHPVSMISSMIQRSADSVNDAQTQEIYAGAAATVYMGAFDTLLSETSQCSQ